MPKEISQVCVLQMSYNSYESLELIAKTLLDDVPQIGQTRSINLHVDLSLNEKVSMIRASRGEGTQTMGCSTIGLPEQVTVPTDASGVGDMCPALRYRICCYIYLI